MTFCSLGQPSPFFSRLHDLASLPKPEVQRVVARLNRQAYPEDQCTLDPTVTARLQPDLNGPFQMPRLLTIVAGSSCGRRAN